MTTDMAHRFLAILSKYDVHSLQRPNAWPVPRRRQKAAVLIYKEPLDLRPVVPASRKQMLARDPIRINRIRRWKVEPVQRREEDCTGGNRPYDVLPDPRDAREHQIDRRSDGEDHDKRHNRSPAMLRRRVCVP